MNTPAADTRTVVAALAIGLGAMIRNVAGANTISGNIGITAVGGSGLIYSAGGSLTLS